LYLIISRVKQYTLLKFDSLKIAHLFFLTIFFLNSILFSQNIVKHSSKYSIIHHAFKPTINQPSKSPNSPNLFINIPIKQNPTYYHYLLYLYETNSIKISHLKEKPNLENFKYFLTKNSSIHNPHLKNSILHHSIIIATIIKFITNSNSNSNFTLIHLIIIN
jgi:hypothetical protein